MYFPEQTRAIMRQVAIEKQSPEEWETMRKRHKHGDEQIKAICDGHTGWPTVTTIRTSRLRLCPESQH